MNRFVAVGCWESGVNKVIDGAAGQRLRSSFIHTTENRHLIKEKSVTNREVNFLKVTRALRARADSFLCVRAVYAASYLFTLQK